MRLAHKCVVAQYTACLHTRAVYRGVNEMGQIKEEGCERGGFQKTLQGWKVEATQQYGSLNMGTTGTHVWTGYMCRQY